MKNQTATIFGGTGFIGRDIVRELAKRGYTIKVATRVPESAFFLRPCGTVGQIVPVACNYGDEASIENAVRGSDVVINCIGSFRPRGKNGFQRIYVDVPQAIAKACKKHGVSRFVHISALGIVGGTSRYAESKRAGEQAVQQEFPAATILRPSVVFGPGDHFFNMFAEMSRYLPAMPLIGGGYTKFQPVFVGDVADAVMAALAPASCGKVYELGGPEVMDFREIYQRMFAATGRKRCLVTLPWGLAKVQATFMGLLPQPPLTRDQVETLKTDSVVADGALTLENLGINPTALELILPGYLICYKSGGQFADKKSA